MRAAAVSAGRKITARWPRRRAVQATARPWLPSVAAQKVTSPRRSLTVGIGGAAGGEVAIGERAPAVTQHHVHGVAGAQALEGVEAEAAGLVLHQQAAEAQVGGQVGQVAQRGGA